MHESCMGRCAVQDASCKSCKILHETGKIFFLGKSGGGGGGGGGSPPDIRKVGGGASGPIRKVGGQSASGPIPLFGTQKISTCTYLRTT